MNKEKLYILNDISNAVDSSPVELPNLSKPSEFITIKSKEGLREYAFGFVTKFGQCMFEKQGDSKFVPKDCFKYNRSLSN